MLLALLETAVPGQRLQQDFVYPLIERSKFQPLIEIAERLLVRRGLDELFQKSSAAGAQAPTLCNQPIVEERAAIDIDVFQNLAAKKRNEFAQPFDREICKSVLRRLRDLGNVDNAIRNIETDRIAGGHNPLPARLIDNGSDPAQTPAKFSARIVGDIPKQFTQLAARHRDARKRQIAEQRPHLS